MNGTVEEWVAKAEADFATASRELRAGENPNYDAVCFHAQQCVEKQQIIDRARCPVLVVK